MSRRPPSLVRLSMRPSAGLVVSGLCERTVGVLDAASFTEVFGPAVVNVGGLCICQCPGVTLLDGQRLDQEEGGPLRGDSWHNEEGRILKSSSGLSLDAGNFGRGVPRIPRMLARPQVDSRVAPLLRLADVLHGCSVEAVTEQLGYALISVTEAVYVQLLPGSRAKAARATEEL
jgi:hypothetical protein